MFLIHFDKDTNQVIEILVKQIDCVYLVINPATLPRTGSL